MKYWFRSFAIGMTLWNVIKDIEITTVQKAVLVFNSFQDVKHALRLHRDSSLKESGDHPGGLTGGLFRDKK